MYKIERNDEVGANEHTSPAKALFYGSIVKPLFWPFPKTSADKEEVLQKVVFARSLPHPSIDLSGLYALWIRPLLLDFLFPYRDYS